MIRSVQNSGKRKKVLNETAVQAAEEEIKARYAEHRKRAQMIESYTPSESHEKFYKRAAEICVSRGIDPGVFVEIQFAAIKPYPYPSALSSEKAVQRYKESLEPYKDELRLEADLQLGALNAAASAGIPVEAELRARLSNYDPVFAYCAAKQHCSAEFAASLLQRAKAHLALHSLLKEVYKVGPELAEEIGVGGI